VMKLDSDCMTTGFCIKVDSKCMILPSAQKKLISAILGIKEEL